MLFKKILANIMLVLSQDPNAIQEIRCVQEAVYYEARGESRDGKIGVANVIENRFKDDRRWRGSRCDIVQARKQFSYRNGVPQGRILKPRLKAGADADAYNESLAIAARSFIGILPDVTNGANHFHNPRLATPSWGRKFKVTASIGGHLYQAG